MMGCPWDFIVLKHRNTLVVVLVELAAERHHVMHRVVDRDAHRDGGDHRRRGVQGHASHPIKPNTRGIGTTFGISERNPAFSDMKSRV